MQKIAQSGHTGCDTKTSFQFVADAAVDADADVDDADVVHESNVEMKSPYDVARNGQLLLPTMPPVEKNKKDEK